MITASIVTYNHSLQDIEQALHSLLKSDVSHIYIIDHSDKEGSDFEASLRQYGIEQMTADADIHRRCQARQLILTYHKHGNNGYGGGHNVAIKMAKQEGSTYHIVANPDIWFDSNVVSEIRDFMDKHDDVGHVMPRVLFPDGSIQRLCRLLPTPMDMFGRLCLPAVLIRKHTELYELRFSGYDKMMNVPFLSGCFMFLRMSALDKIGIFDERFFMYAEDIDLTRRMHAQYKTIYFPKVTIYHRFSRASRKEIKLFFVHISSIFMYFNKYGWFIDSDRKAINKKTIEECASCS